MGSFSLTHWLVVILVIVLLFGRGRISDLMGDFAKGINSFKKGLNDDAAPGSPQAPAVADFYRRNAAHFAPWDPPLPPDHAAPERIAQALAEGAEAFATGRSLRWWLQLADEPGRVVGQVHLSSLVRGCFQSCNLGYALDAGCQGQGLMHEALRQKQRQDQPGALRGVA